MTPPTWLVGRVRDLVTELCDVERCGDAQAVQLLGLALARVAGEQVRSVAHAISLRVFVPRPMTEGDERDHVRRHRYRRR